MIKIVMITALSLSAVWADTEMRTDLMMKPMEDTAMIESAKLKRDSWPIHSTPCPPTWPHYQKGWIPETPKVQYVHKPPVVIKPHVPSYHSSWQAPDPWQQNSGWNKPSYSLPVSHGWQSGWKAPSYPSYQSKIIVQKPSYSYAPQYHKPTYQLPSYHKPLIKPAVVVKPDCPPYEHSHSGPVYAPQHQYHQPEVVKVVKPAYHPKPVYHAPPPVYHHPAPVYHKPAPVYHQPAPVYHHPAPVYHKPAPVYHHPAPTYNHHIAPAYHIPTPVYHPKVEPCD